MYNLIHKDNTTSKITANFTHYLIKDYEIGDSNKLERMLTVFDRRRFRVDPVGLVYDEEEKELRIPRGFPIKLLQSCISDDIYINQKSQDFDKINIELYQEPRDKDQIKVMAFLCGMGNKYSYTAKHSQLFVNLNTGKGKTYTSIASMCHFKMKTVIITPGKISKIADQWYESILKYTNKKPKDILIVKGSKICIDIIDGKYTDKEIFIINRSTISSFTKKCGWNEFEKLIESMRVGLKIIDEEHLEFKTNVSIDCYSNVKRNIYLTSSAGRGKPEEDSIFKKVFDSVPIMGKELTTVEDNYMIMIIYKFFHTPSMTQRLDCKGRDGLSAIEYSKYLVNPNAAKYIFFTALDTAIKNIFIKYRQDNGKLLILGSTREFLQTISRFLEKNHPEYSVGMYTSDVAVKVRHLELEKDIILGTDKGLSTGADIQDLQCVINLIPYSNKILADQISGRLRQINKQTYYIELVNAEFQEAYNQYTRRKKYLGQKAKDGKIIEIEV